MHQIELFMKYPHDVQEEWFRKLIGEGKNTEWGKKHGYSSIATIEQFKKNVPIQDYESLKGFIDKMRQGEKNILWPGEVRWFAKSSGTTSDKSKYIPVSEESLEGCHFNGGRDMVAIHCFNNENTQLFTGKNLGLAGSLQTHEFNRHESYSGDLSAIVVNNLPKWAEFLRSPDISIALLGEWEEKLDKLAHSTINENITSIAGVPSWMLVLFQHILKITGQKSISDVWPNLEVFFHGGVNFSPYREQFKNIIQSDKVSYLELYNASEGFFGIQFEPKATDMLLMLDYGIYYEFMPLEEIGKSEPITLSLHEVRAGVNYALVISTNAGLWRYMLGDTIKFTSLEPFRFVITGRTKLFINAFGEEVIIDNAEKAISVACEKTGAIVTEYTAAPVFMQNNESGAHEWLIEFEKAPDDLGYFTEVLDNALKSVNSDYEAKRYHNMALKGPLVRIVKPGTFYNWLKSKGKLGGQHKVPRLSNDRKHIEDILRSFNDSQ